MDECAIKRILLMREGGHVERVHYAPHHGTYKVSEHSFQMALLLDQLHPSPSAKLYRAILRHDVLERFVGDVPSSAKRNLPGLKAALDAAEGEIADRLGIDFPELDAEERSWLLALDTIEFLMWVDDQLALGNEHLRPKHVEVWDWLEGNSHALPEECNDFLESYKWERTPDYRG